MEGRFLGCFSLIILIQSAFAYRPLPRGEFQRLSFFLSLSSRLAWDLYWGMLGTSFCAFRTTPFLFMWFKSAHKKNLFSEVCLLPVDDGPCKADIPRFYYDTLTQQCTEFSYGGCGGNDNNFKSSVECLKTCYSIPST